MMQLLGLTLEEALTRLAGEGIEPEVAYTASAHENPEGTLRVTRVDMEGRRLTAARFPDHTAVRIEE